MLRSSETRADSGKNLARLKAEQAWTALHEEDGLPLHIFRLGGAFPYSSLEMDSPPAHCQSPETCFAHCQKIGASGFTLSAFSAGIYGPGRSALEAASQQVIACVPVTWRRLDARRWTPSMMHSLRRDLVLTQRASTSQERRGRQRFTARCHVHDICTVIQASMQHPNPGSVYNIVDDEPAPRWVARDSTGTGSIDDIRHISVCT